jgi:hypothetical protein
MVSGVESFLLSAVSTVGAAVVVDDVWCGLAVNVPDVLLNVGVVVTGAADVAAIDSAVAVAVAILSADWSTAVLDVGAAAADAADADAVVVMATAGFSSTVVD